MASARCAYCGATLTPNSAYCLECGQQIMQPSAAVSAAVPAAASAAPAAAAAAPAPAGVPLPRSLPWQTSGVVDAAPVAVAPAPARTLTSVELVLSDGQRMRVDGKTVLGRQPADTARTMGARSVPVPDTTRSVSRVHLFLDLVDGRLTVADAGSANGSRLQRGEVLHQLEVGGSAVMAMPGDVVWLGDVAVSLQP